MLFAALLLMVVNSKEKWDGLCKSIANLSITLKTLKKIIGDRNMENFKPGTTKIQPANQQKVIAS